jgi:hypothetical protein
MYTSFHKVVKNYAGVAFLCVPYLWWRISCNTTGAGNATNTCRYRLLPVRSNNTDTFPTSAEEEVIRIVYSVKGTVDCYAFFAI